MNDIKYQDMIIEAKSDTINGLKYDIEALNIKNEKLNDKIESKNTGLWIQGSLNFILGIITLVISK